MRNFPVGFGGLCKLGFLHGTTVVFLLGLKIARMLAGIKNRKSNDPHKWYFPSAISSTSEGQTLELCVEMGAHRSSFQVNNSSM